tara:strand:+ start:41 stop:607 length:567 start_codon:yes stop_codon:yes gene_type:complete
MAVGRAIVPLQSCRWSPVQVHRSHGIALQLPDASLAQLQSYLSQPGRPLKALLNRKKVERMGGGRYLYTSRPYQLLTFELQPEVVFRSHWDGDQLSIVFEQCTIHGLGRLQELVQFRCQAWIRPEQERLMAKADLSLELSISGAIKRLPQSLVQRTAGLALVLVTDRLEKRCRTGLRKGALDWVACHP